MGFNSGFKGLIGFNYKICKGTCIQNSELTRNWITNMNTTQKDLHLHYMKLV